MRVLHAVSAAILTAALVSPAAFAQSDAREGYGPVAAARGKPEPKANAPAKPATAQPTAAKPATPPKAAAAAKPVENASAPAAPASEVTTDGRSARGKKVRTAKGKLATRKPVAAKRATGKTASAKPAAAKPTTAKPVTGKPESIATLSVAAAEKQSALRQAYTALPPADRLAIQLNLIWTGDYRGFADGEFSDRLVEATKEYQKRNKLKVTGLLAPEEREALAVALEPRQSYAGWRMVEDPVTGARLGIPTRFATHVAAGSSGTRWSSEQGQLQIETFRIDTGATLEAVFEQQKKMPRRRVSGSNLLGDSFVISGMQGLKKMRVVAFARGGEVRGLTILYDQAMEGSIDPLVLPIAGAYLPFAQGLAFVAAAEAPRRKVEYGTGVFVSAAGHVLTDRSLVDSCQIVTLPGLGHAERVAEDRPAGLALLRINGVSGTAIAPLAGDDEDAGQLTLVGVADPTSQAGGGAVSTSKASTGSAVGATRTLDQAPALGFSGAGAFNASGRLAGLVQLQPLLTSSATPSSARAAVVPAGTIRRFLQQQGVASSEAALGDAQSAVTRVICVRK